MVRMKLSEIVEDVLDEGFQAVPGDDWWVRFEEGADVHLCKAREDRHLVVSNGFP